jgi:Chaperone of endosialidase
VSRGQRSFASARGGFSRGGGGRGGGGRGGGRRSDVNLKHDIVLLGQLDDGLGFYRFAYNGSNTAYVGVMAQEVQTLRPSAVTRGRDGYLRVTYEKLGLTFQTYEHWIAAGARIPKLQ